MLQMRHQGHMQQQLLLLLQQQSLASTLIHITVKMGRTRRKMKKQQSSGERLQSCLSTVSSRVHYHVV